MKRVPFVSIGVHLSRPRGRHRWRRRTRRWATRARRRRRCRRIEPTRGWRWRARRPIRSQKPCIMRVNDTAVQAREHNRHRCHRRRRRRRRSASPTHWPASLTHWTGRGASRPTHPWVGFLGFNGALIATGRRVRPSTVVSLHGLGDRAERSLRPRAPDVDDRLPFRVDSRLRPLRRSPSSPSVAGPCPFLPRRPSRRLPAPRRPMMRSSGGASTHSTPRDRPIGSARSSA